MSHVVVNDVAKPTLTVIFLHGLGGSGMSWENMVHPIAPMFPTVKFILPSAPRRRMSFCGDTMPSWYDIIGFAEHHAEDEGGIKDSTKSVHKIIEEEEKKGTSSDRILLAGASQGGAIALYAGLTIKKRLAGILALSTYLPLNATFPSVLAEENLTTPVLMCHGEQDDIVKFEWGKRSYEVIKGLHKNITFKSYKNMGHSSCPQEMFDIMGFLAGMIHPPAAK
jgi:predicted esterase